MTDPTPDNLHRYHRQMLLPGIGEEGQKRLLNAHALVVGCGALGSAIIDSLARAGVGTLTIIDRDIVEITNLQRQILFDERDVAEGIPKAEAAKARISAVNSQVTVHAHVDDFNYRNAGRHAAGVDVILDGLDNFETRYLLNDLAVAQGLPYIYGGAVAATGVSMAILPHTAARIGDSSSSVRWTDEQATPCLRCVHPEAPPPGASPTCDTAGVLAPAVTIIAAHQAAQAIKLLTGNIEALDRTLLSIDLWSNATRRLDVSSARKGEGDDACHCCALGDFMHLRGASASTTLSLCGRNAVQVTPPETAGGPAEVDLERTAHRLAAHGSFTFNQYLLRGRFDAETGEQGEPIELTLFPTGRAIIRGITEPDAARSIYARYIGA